MTEQELKEKIVEILRYHRDDFIEENYRRDIERIDFDALADALILEGIGDVSEWKHRAEVAERCFDIITTNMSRLKRCVILLFAMKKIPISKAIMQAEKELAEEKEENNAKNQRE